MTDEKIKVEIRGRSFGLDAAGLTEIEASAIARVVSEKMDEIEAQTQIVDTARLAVMTALSFADELLRLRSNEEKANAEFLQRVRAMAVSLEQSLQVPPN